MTDANQLVRATTRLRILERFWGADPDFLQKHGDLYNSVLEEQHRRKAAILMTLGRTREAQAELRRVKNALLLYRLVAALPAPVARALVPLRKTVKERFTKR